MMTHTRQTQWQTARTGKKLFPQLMGACLLLFGGFLIIFAQQSNRESKESAALFRERTEVVTLIVTVTDRHGQAVTGLTREHFRLQRRTGIRRFTMQYI
jgi:hypothetical protein